MSMPNTGYVPGASSSGTAAAHAVAAGDALSSFDTGTKVMAERDGVFVPGTIDGFSTFKGQRMVKFDADGKTHFCKPSCIKRMTDEELEAARLRVATLYCDVEAFCKCAKRRSNLPCKVTYYCTLNPPNPSVATHCTHHHCRKGIGHYVSHPLSSPSASPRSPQQM